MAANKGKGKAKEPTGAQATGDAKMSKSSDEKGKAGRKPTGELQKYELTATGKKFDPEKEKLAKQAKGIIACLNELGGSALKADLVRRLPDFITTKQTADRILQHYKKPLEEKGLIRVTELKEEKKAA